MDRIDIRGARAADAEQLLPLIEAYWRHDGIAGFVAARLRRQLDEFLSSPAYGAGWMATLAGAPIGYLLCTLVYSFEHGGLMAEIDELFVDPGHRRRGIGQGLVSTARGQLSTLGCRALQMQVADDNGDSQRFYAQLGFREKRGYRLWVTALEAPAKHP